MTTAGEWDDVACGTARQFICEKPDLDQVTHDDDDDDDDDDDLDQGSAGAASPACSCGDGWTANLDTNK